MLYLEKPEGFTQVLEAVGCFVVFEGKILLLKRHSKDIYPNLWGLPSGKMKNGETSISAMIRELREETGINGEKLMFLGKSFIIYPKIQFPYHVFRIDLEKYPRIKLNPREHVAFYFEAPQNIKARPDIMLDTDACIEHFYK